MAVLVATADDKATMLCAVSKDLAKQTPAGEIIKQVGSLAGMRGGGRPDLAPTLLMIEKVEQVVAEQVSLILGSNFVISFQEKEGDVFNAIRDRIKKGKGRIRRSGSGPRRLAVSAASWASSRDHRPSCSTGTACSR